MDNITVAIATYNSATWLQQTLDAIKGQNILVCDNSSIDKTVEILTRNGIEPFFFPHESRRRFNIKSIRSLLAKAITTEYIFFLDSDVILPENSIQQAYDYLIAQGVDAVAISYGSTTHIQQGAVLMKTSVAQSIEYTFNNEGICSCQDMTDSLTKFNKKIVYLPNVMALHRKMALAQLSIGIKELSDDLYEIPVYKQRMDDTGKFVNALETIEKVSQTGLRKERLLKQKELADIDTKIKKLNDFIATKKQMEEENA